MKKIAAMVMIIATLVCTAIGSTAQAIDLFPNDVCKGQDCGVVKASESALGKQVQNIINMAIYLIGGVSVIMMIIGGMRMAIAQGDPGNIKAGRLAVLWSVVGVAVALLASAIVNLVINWNWLK